MQGFFGITAMVLLAALTVLAFLKIAGKRKWWKSIWLYVIAGGSAVLIPLATNWILFISPSVNYHLLMRYQWVVFPVCMIAFLSKGDLLEGTDGSKFTGILQWAALLCGAVLVFHYGVNDQIAYSNLAKKYEKTYAYCLRLLDRIEQTPGYYQGIPIAMIGVVGDEPYPVTDLTGEVTNGMIGMNGDYLVYTGANYEAFMKHYLGATLHFLPAESMEDMYYNPVYRSMPSFPAAGSIQLIDGILYVKTENIQK